MSAFPLGVAFVASSPVLRVSAASQAALHRPHFRSLRPCLPAVLNPNVTRRTTSCNLLRFTKQNIPNRLTYLRVLLIPVIAVNSLLLPPFNGQCALSSALFVIASLTDLLDGYLARRWNVISPVGIFLDPVADKLLVALSLIILTARFPCSPAVTISTAIIIIREIFISALREWMAINGKSAQVKVSFLGKLKTATQMVAVALLLATPYVYSALAPFGFVLLVLSAVLTFVSAAQYISASLSAFR